MFRAPLAGQVISMLGTLIARTLIGGLFIGHGTQKLFGWFDGHGLEGTGRFFESIGLRPGRENAIAAGAAETAGGALLATGIFTPAAGTALSGVMTTAIRHVHADKGPWSTEGGWEYNAVLLAAIFSIVEREKGAAWALASTAAGAAGSLIASELGGRLQQPPEGHAEGVVEVGEPAGAAEARVSGSPA